MYLILEQVWLKSSSEANAHMYKIYGYSNVIFLKFTKVSK